MTTPDHAHGRLHGLLWLVALLVGGAAAGLAYFLFAAFEHSMLEADTRRFLNDNEVAVFGGLGVAVTILAAGASYALGWFRKRPARPPTPVSTDPGAEALPDTVPNGRMSLPAYMMGLYLPMMFGVGLVTLGSVNSAAQEAIIPGIFLAVVGWIGWLVFVYRAWSMIQDGYARTSPGRAIGVLFVPLYNLYWLFQVLPGFAEDFNALRARYGLQQVPPVSQGWFTAYAVLSLVPFGSLVAIAVVLPVLIRDTTRAVNALDVTAPRD